MKTNSFLFFFLLFVYNHELIFARSLFNVDLNKAANICGYESCGSPKDGFLNVHIIPHTHDDVGWLKTLDQYYYGARSNIQKAGVQYILDTVIEELRQNPERKFIFVESAFFFTWWEEQDEETRTAVQELVNSGRLEFVGGAWSMNDEAATHYQSTIDQFSWGLRRLNDTFGECGRPRVGWQIDPFGHSREFASILAGMGFDGLLLGRIDFQDKNFRQDNKQMEQIWQASANLGDERDIFTSVLYNRYSPPPGFCFDVLCGDDPIIDNKRSAEYNVDQKVEDFSNWIKDMSQKYRSNNLAITMGDDFHYQDARMWFRNLDKLIKYVNKNQDNGGTLNLLYSTPSCYLKAVNDEGINWDTKQDDFFPYGSDSHSYWTGYFTSRPTLKYFERLGNNFLQVCKQLTAQSKLLTGDTNNQLTALREAMGVMQHHDAITGTEKQQVAEDYARILNAAIEECSLASQDSLNKLMATSSVTQDSWNSCLLINQSACEFSENSKNLIVTIYNPLSHEADRVIRLPVIKDVDYSVYDSNGSQIIADLVPIPDSVLNINGRASKATLELLFLAEKLPALGLRSYYISQEKGSGLTKLAQESDDDNINSQYSQVTIDKTSGAIKSATFNDISIDLNIDINYYEGFEGDNNGADHRSSGAYVFRPKSDTPKGLTDNIKSKVIKGQLVEEIQRTLNAWTSQVVRLYRNSVEVEVEWLVGPIPIDDKIGKEIISVYSTNLKSNGQFYTDSNGRELLKRTRNSRDSWNVELEEIASGNYYPIVSQLSLRDDDQSIGLSVITDRAQGGSSLNDGQLELMLHRRLMHDDAFGVGEALNELAFNDGLIVRGKHWLIAGSLSKKPYVTLEARTISQENILAPWIFLTPIDDLNVWNQNHLAEKKGLNTDLPSNVQILTLEPWRENSVLIRLEHILEKGDDPDLSTSVDVDLSNLLISLNLESIRETTLDGNQWLSDTYKLKWNKNDALIKKINENHKIDDELVVNLKPMEIRTFIAQITN